MAMTSFYVGAYWGDRKESAEECARRLSGCLTALTEVDPLLGSWRGLGRSRTTSQTLVGTDAGSLEQLLLKGRNRRDADRSVIEELGFQVGMWNGQETEISLSASVGGYAGTPGLSNAVVLKLPAPVGIARRLYGRQVAQRITEAIVESWEPNWATWASHPLQEVQDAPARTPVVGWLTYLSQARLAPDSAHTIGAEPLHGGWLVRAADDVDGVSGDVVLALRRSLQTAGALSPTPLEVS
jgi:hypothetical protein